MFRQWESDLSLELLPVIYDLLNDFLSPVCVCVCVSLSLAFMWLCSSTSLSFTSLLWLTLAETLQGQIFCSSPWHLNHTLMFCAGGIFYFTNICTFIRSTASLYFCFHGGGTLHVVAGPLQWPSNVFLQLTWTSASSGDVTRLATFEAIRTVVCLSTGLAGSAAPPSLGTAGVQCPFCVLTFTGVQGNDELPVNFIYLYFVSCEHFKTKVKFLYYKHHKQWFTHCFPTKKDYIICLIQILHAWCIVIQVKKNPIIVGHLFLCLLIKWHQLAELASFCMRHIFSFSHNYMHDIIWIWTRTSGKKNHIHIAPAGTSVFLQ